LHELHASIAQALERIGRSARLVRAAAEKLGTATGDEARRRLDLHPVLDCARAGDRHEAAIAERRTSDANDRSIFDPFACELVHDNPTFAAVKKKAAPVRAAVEVIVEISRKRA
jgi:hypothetical protein